jgi:hypothetical protein
LRSNELPSYPLSNWYLGALSTLRDKENPDRLAQAGNSLREILEHLPRTTGVEIKEIKKDVYETARQKVEDGMAACKKLFYPEGWTGLIVKPLVDVFGHLDEYFALTRRPTRQATTAEGILKSQPILEFTSAERREFLAAKLVKCGRAFQRFTHHSPKAGGENKFRAALTTFERLLMEVFNPSAVEVQMATRELVKQDPLSFEKTKLDKILNLLARRPADYEYFFRNLKSAAWVAPLNERGFFSSPLPMKKVGDGYVQFPLWLPLLYLIGVAKDVPEQAVAICCTIPATDNTRIYADILQVGLAVADPALSTKLAPKILEGTKIRFHPFNDGYGKLLAHWATRDESTPAALELAASLLPFQPDPREAEKIARRETEPEAWDTLLEPYPKFESWSYQRILEDGVRPLSKRVPWETANMLIQTLVGYIALKFHGPDGIWERKHGDDHSAVWCTRVSGFEGEHREPNAALAHALTAASEEVCRRGDRGHVVALDGALREARWRIFTRIRHYLYAQYPALFRDEIRKDILSFSDYAEDDYGREMAEMIQSSTRHFGAGLLSPEEYNAIVTSILKGPDYEAYKKFMAEEFTEANFVRRRNYLHRQQLWPFEAILTGEGLSRFQEASAALTDAPTLDNYSPVDFGGGRDIISESPISQEELAAMPDQDLIRYLNDWDRPQRDRERWWVTFDQYGLVGAFIGCIEKAPARFAAWTDQWSQLSRPIFLRGVIDLGTRTVEARNFAQLNMWLHVCEAALNKPIRLDVDTRELTEESAEKPRWERVRGAVEAFGKACLKDNSGYPLAEIPTLANIVKQLCLGPDTTLDCADSIYRDSNDPISTAINTTRGRALELAETMVFWLRKANSTEHAAKAQELFVRIIDTRFSDGPELTDPEKALLAVHFVNLLVIDKAWAQHRLPQIFNRDPLPAWLLAFGNFLRYTHAQNALFEVLQDEYRFALDHLGELRENDGDRRHTRESSVDSLGLHLFFFYMWGRYTLAGSDSLVKDYLEKATPDELETLVRHAGASFERSKGMREDQKVRARDFLDSRISAAEKARAGTPPIEFHGIYGWLKCEQFPADWRLRSFLRLLNLNISVDAAALYVECLHSMLPDNLALVIECFAKLSTKAKDPNFYIDTKEGKAILLAGSKSKDDAVRSLTREARENLVDAGKSEFLDD